MVLPAITIDKSSARDMAGYESLGAEQNVQVAEKEKADGSTSSGVQIMPPADVSEDPAEQEPNENSDSDADHASKEIDKDTDKSGKDADPGSNDKKDAIEKDAGDKDENEDMTGNDEQSDEQTKLLKRK